MDSIQGSGRLANSTIQARQVHPLCRLEDINLGAVSEAREEPLAILPRQAEGPNVGQADVRRNVAQGVVIGSGFEVPSIMTRSDQSTSCSMVTLCWRYSLNCFARTCRVITMAYFPTF